jgi:membrane-associated phospholipid phosphatase
MADKYGIFLAVCFSLAVLNTENYLLLINTSSIGVCVNIIVKMIIRDARPYFYSSEYKPVSCDFEYGSPSGHAQSVTTFYLTLITLVLKQYDFSQKSKTLMYLGGYSY